MRRVLDLSYGGTMSTEENNLRIVRRVIEEGSTNRTSLSSMR